MSNQSANVSTTKRFLSQQNENAPDNKPDQESMSKAALKNKKKKEAAKRKKEGNNLDNVNDAANSNKTNVEKNEKVPKAEVPLTVDQEKDKKIKNIRKVHKYYKYLTY